MTELVRDPVCGMMVAPVESSPHVETPTGVVYFCGTGCRNAYLDNPLAYAAVIGENSECRGTSAGSRVSSQRARRCRLPR